MATYNGDNGNNYYVGTAGDDVIEGNGGDDSLFGNGGNDTVTGGADNDSLYGGDGNDTLSGGAGNDTLWGGAGNDTYLVAKNGGIDALYTGGGSDVVKFTDVAAADIKISRSTSDLLLQYSGGQLTVQSYFNSTDYRVGQFQFSNGIVWGWADISLKVLQGTANTDILSGYDDSNDTLNGLAGNDWLYGNGGNDTLNGGTGSDTLSGGLGNDTYLIAKNDGADTLYDNGGTDVVKFTDMAATDMTQVSRIGVSYSNGDLLLSYSGGQLIVTDYFNEDMAYYRIEQFQFSNGAVWAWADIKAKALHPPTSGNDRLYGYDDSNDNLNGLAGNDRLYGFNGNDTLNGGTGNDWLEGGLGNDTYLIAKNDGVDSLIDNGGTDVVKFTDLAATGITRVSREGFYGNDLVLGYGSSQLTVQSYFYSTDYRIEQFQFSNGVVWGWADIKVKALQAANSSGNDNIYGYDDSNDTLNGLAGNDTLYGFNGNDTLNGGIGNDYLEGGAGNDIYLIAKNDGADTLYDFGGTDVVKFTDLATNGITQVSRVGLYNTDLLLAYGGSQLTVTDYFSSAGYRVGQFQFSDGVMWGWADIKLKVLHPTSGDDHLDGYDDSGDILNGLAGNDTLNGGGGNDTLNGGSGNDLLYGGVGDDTYLIAKNDGDDTLYDFGGIDRVVFTNLASTDITQVSRFGGFYYGDILLLGYGNSQLTLPDYFSRADDRVEQFQFSDGVVWGWADIKSKVLQGTGGNDTLYGYDDSNDILNGLAGNDTLMGGGGDDTLNGGTGNDKLDGGQGADTYLIAKNDGADSISTDNGGTDTVKFTDMSATDISQVSRVGAGYDLLLSYGSSQLTVQYYFGVTDSRVGQFLFSNGVVWRWADIKAKVLQTAATSGDDSVEGFDDSDDTLNGLAGNDSLYGYGGNDSLDGGTGNDSMVGGKGDDRYWVDSALDHVYEYLNGGNDTVYSSVSFSLWGYGVNFVENLTLLVGGQAATGNILDNILIGNAAANSLNGLTGDDVLQGGDGNDSLNGGAGNDTLDGGNGTDVAHYWDATAGVSVNLALTGAQDTLGAGTDTLVSIEGINGSTYNDTLTGNAANNSLWGGAGNDTLKGGDGNDGLTGGLGTNILDGGNGLDVAQYYTASAGVTVNLALTTAQNTVGAGTDILRNIEAINGSAYNDTLTGNTTANSLWGGGGNDVLDGGLGNDLLKGGLGQDTFVFDTALGLNNKDTFDDFTVSDDTIRLENAIFTALTHTGVLAADQFKILGNGGVADSTDRILYNSVSGGLFYDADGNGTGAAVLVAVLGKGLAMTAADFMVV
ncbi:beta strand repeat-containing protein [Methylovulum psychrotolerans]|uniref:Haemolysin-type calcium binding-related domain-containing protein n=1 Tax=Methylovulum psychrotolerans TaxID=1704499 RepID=A0A1Z4C206_9GAMM|nr:calcium-binding protein [Methylovulum psychrotolerans]ASF47549.1 hypothetical protein CEK71_16595 [Methylovulum psychrotolerans]